MPFLPPIFNLTYRMWFSLHNPWTDVADEIGLCQKYINPRCDVDGYYEPTVGSRFYVPTIIFRLPSGSLWERWGFIQCPSGTGLYYSIYFGELQHEGFVNEYLMLLAGHYPPPSQEPPWYGAPPLPP